MIVYLDASALVKRYLLHLTSALPYPSTLNSTGASTPLTSGL